LRLAFLGTGAAFSPERYNGAVVVDGRLLLDGGAPLLPHMHRCGVGPEGLAERLESLWAVSWGQDWGLAMRDRFKVTYQEAKASGSAGGYKYESVKLDHGTSGSSGYRIKVGGKILAYSGDTEATSPLDKLVDGADVAIVEATGPGDVFSHMSWEAAKDLKARHPKTRFMFNHLYSGTLDGAVSDLEVVEV
jgi:hypothetical protein